MQEEFYDIVKTGMDTLKNLLKEYSREKIEKITNRLDSYINALTRIYNEDYSLKRKQVIKGLLYVFEGFRTDLEVIRSVGKYKLITSPDYEVERIENFIRIFSNSKPLKEDEVKKSIEIANKYGSEFMARYLMGRRYKLKVYISEEVKKGDVKNILDDIIMWLTYFSEFEILNINIRDGENIIDAFRKIEREAYDEYTINLIISSKDIKTKAFDKNMREVEVPAHGFSDFEKPIAFSPYFPENIKITSLVAIHEIAHLFGLKHCENDRCLMYVPYKITTNMEDMLKQYMEVLRFKTGFCDKCYGELEFVGQLSFYFR